MLKISSLHTYPVKGLGGMTLDSAQLTIKGFKWDRRFMLTDAQGKFISQREAPQCTQLVAEIQDELLVIRLRQMPDTRISLPLQFIEEGQRPMVQIWSSRVRAVSQSTHINEWLSDQLRIGTQLVYMPDSTRRSVPPVYAGVGQTVSFADGYPYLVVNQASLDELNTRLDTPVPMDRFRPNIVVSGSDTPWEEDTWRDLQIGNIHMRCVKTCARCIVITTDQQTGERSKEPLATLAKYRKEKNRILFGMNTILAEKQDVGQSIRVGDVVNLEN